VPSDVIVDASMPYDSYIRTNVERRKSQDTLAVIPDRSYAGIYTATIDFL
jgi:isocitrate dehydrogenase